MDLAEAQALLSSPTEANCAARLDSGGAGRWARWSYLPDPPVLRLTCDAQTRVTRLRDAGGVVLAWDDPLAALAWMEAQCTEAPAGGPPFKCGWIGFLGYDLGRLFEAIGQSAAEHLTVPLFDFTWHNGGVAVDHSEGRAYRTRACGAGFGLDPGTSVQAEACTTRRIAQAEACTTTGAAVCGAGFSLHEFSRDAYEAAVARVIEYIAAGDIFQANLSQRFSAPLPDAPHVIYDRLRRQFPAWFGAYLRGDDWALLSNSPELFLRITPHAGGRHVITRPIKGTRPVGPGMRAELAGSIKDQAELNMIVDLERNDLGRICRIGSVRVVEPRVIEAHPTVYHGAATIAGELRDDVGLVDLLAATFPGGSVTGAPKIRAMQIIEELEPVRRGPYCGAIGYLSSDGHMQLNIAIRTIIVDKSGVHVSVGGGIVADSVPADEYEETLVKAQAMFAALGMEQFTTKTQRHEGA